MQNQEELYPVATLSAQEKSEIAKKIVHSHAIIQSEHAESLWDLRYQYKNGKVNFTKKVRDAMEVLLDLEPVLVAGYYRMAKNLSYRIFSRNSTKMGGDFDDFLQVAVLSIVKSIYSYNGEREFITLCHAVMKNDLVTHSLNYDNQFGQSVKVQSIATKVRRLAKIENIDFEDALQILQKELKFSKRIAAKVRASYFGVSALAVDVAADKPKSSCYVELQNAIDNTDLTDFERELLEARLNGQVGYETELACTRINPSTGRLYTKQRVSQILKQAMTKVREASKEVA